MAKGGSGLLGALFGGRRASAPEFRSAWHFAFVALDGQPLPLSRFEGQAVLVVNTASQCAFTSQYGTAIPASEISRARPGGAGRAFQ